tara:strand:- start:439 stop:612 length:174 start_codon:yes stop_codon:yes gene_type:complete
MNDIMVGVLGWMGLIGFTAWLYLFVKMLVRKELSIDNHTSDETESIEYKHTVMASDE